MQAPKPHTKTLEQRQTEAHIVKPAELIDFKEVSGGLTLADRRVYNLLLANAWDTIKEPVLHVIRLHELRSSNQDNNRPRDSLQRLMKIVVSFDVEEEGIKRTVLTQLLGPCKLDHNPQGLAYYTFPEPIRAALGNSSVFARLRRDLLCQFRSKYALSLYEMAQKRINLAYKTSEDFTIDDIRKKLGVEKGLYSAYQSLNLRVLKPAVSEVNGISDIDCLFEPILEGRKTVGLRLSWRKKDLENTVKNAKRTDLKVVENKSQSPTPEKTEKRLRELDTRECEQLKKTFFGYDIYSLYNEFQHWIDKTQADIPENPPAAFTNWLKKYYKITGPQQAHEDRTVKQNAEIKQNAAAEAKRAEKEKLARSQADMALSIEWFEALPEGERKALESAFLAASNPVDIGGFKKSGCDYIGFRFFIKKLWHMKHS